MSGIIENRVAAAHRAARLAKQRFLGEHDARAMPVEQRARGYEKRGGVIPTFAARVKAVRDRLRRAEREFRRAYRVAWERWSAGDRSVAFPAGTWSLRVFHAARIAESLAA
jgi:hypothetical protein